MILYPIKTRPECDVFHLSNYIQITTTKFYMWRNMLNNSRFKLGGFYSPKKDPHDFNKWIRGLNK